MSTSVIERNLPHVGEDQFLDLGLESAPLQDSNYKIPNMGSVVSQGFPLTQFTSPNNRTYLTSRSTLGYLKKPNYRNWKASSKTRSSVSQKSAMLKIMDKFGLSVNETAEVYGVSRQMVYGWLKQDNSVEKMNKGKDIKTRVLYELANQCDGVPEAEMAYFRHSTQEGIEFYKALCKPEVTIEQLWKCYDKIKARTRAIPLEEGERCGGGGRLAGELFEKISKIDTEIDARCDELIRTTVAWACSENPAHHGALIAFYDLLAGVTSQEDPDFDLKTSALALKIHTCPTSVIESYQTFRKKVRDEILEAPGFSEERRKKFLKLYDL